MSISVPALSSALLGGCMHDAARKGDIKTMKFRLDIGANINAVERFGTDKFPFGSINQPIIPAASRGHKDIVEYLIKRGAKLTPEAKRGTLLYIVPHTGDIKWNRLARNVFCGSFAKSDLTFGNIGRVCKIK